MRDNCYNYSNNSLADNGSDGDYVSHFRCVGPSLVVRENARWNRFPISHHLSFKSEAADAGLFEFRLPSNGRLAAGAAYTHDRPFTEATRPTHPADSVLQPICIPAIKLPPIQRASSALYVNQFRMDFSHPPTRQHLVTKYLACAPNAHGLRSVMICGLSMVATSWFTPFQSRGN